MTIFEVNRETIHRIAYGIGRPKPPVKTPTAFRSERARPYQRAGQLVSAVPQFATLTLYSPTSKNNPVPPITTTSTSITLPGRAGLKFP